MQPLGGGLRQRAAALAAAHHGECHRGDHDGERDDQEQEHNHRWVPTLGVLGVDVLGSDRAMRVRRLGSQAVDVRDVLGEVTADAQAGQA
ncbi:hypothetical protein Saso_72330 [Streptomyces asoensis]|uniref:Uncharacterized protein n=1 Tax=Streptomyces asoensis TaxID=249586 RepID=A0ABQ3SBT3_9ACTN|nr:hypothetical protein GCM10010496_21230 [Streptomyces asoensis]GHI65583.1 hypothetical protein Saso_72330 [Streptomyces asoensis]